MNLSPSLTVGDLIVAASFILGGIVAYGRFSARLAVLEAKVDALWRRYTGQAPPPAPEGR